MNKYIRCVIIGVVVGVVVYNSVYFKKLNEVKAGMTSFNAARYAAEFWQEKLIPSLTKAIETGQLFSLLNTDKNKAFADHSHALGIGNIKYFLVKGKGTVKSVEENQVILKIESDFGNPEVRIATEYIFGNAVRDASGLIDVNEFANSMDFNNVSAEINRIIREKVVPPFRSKVKAGDQIVFTGAIELNQAHLNLNKPEILPVSLQIADK